MTLIYLHLNKISFFPLPYKLYLTMNNWVFELHKLYYIILLGYVWLQNLCFMLPVYTSKGMRVVEVENGQFENIQNWINNLFLCFAFWQIPKTIFYLLLLPFVVLVTIFQNSILYHDFWSTFFLEANFWSTYWKAVNYLIFQNHWISFFFFAQNNNSIIFFYIFTILI